jgi:hypothetical protein
VGQRASRVVTAFAVMCFFCRSASVARAISAKIDGTIADPAGKCGVVLCDRRVEVPHRGS